MPTVTGIATEFITFTRASNATVTDSDGLVKWAPHNLLTNSESFDAASWTKSSVTPTANSIAAPNGTTTADTLAASGANGTTLQTFTAEAISYTFGVWLKRKTGTGNIQIAADSGTYTTVTITSDWALYTVTQTPAAGSKSAGIRIVTSADEVYAWGASLYRSDLAMQPNTSAYPMYNPTTPKNLLGYTESLTTGWTNSNTTDAIVSEVNPVGLTGAVDVAATAGNGTLLSSLSLLASPYTFSIWLKRKTGSGTVEITVDGTTYVAAAVTGTWTRFSTTLTPTAGTKTPGIRLVTSGDAVYAWGAQLSDSASLDSYVPVYGAAVTSAAYYGPRRDFDGATLACKGLLVEEQRANLVLYSEQFDNAYWSKTNATITANAVAAPSGVSTADKIVATSATGAHYAGTGSITISASTSYTASVYLKAAEYGWAILYIGSIGAGQYINLSTGALGSTFIGAPTSITVSNAGSGWWRVSMVVASGANTICDMRVYATTANSISSFTGDDVSGIYAWGAQLDSVSGGNAPFATSYIPTTTASATRNADVASVSTQAFPYSATEGTIVVNASSPCIAAIANMITLDNGTTQERIRLLTDVASVKTIVTESNTTQANLSPGSATANTPFKFAVAYKVNDFAAVVNGSAAATDAAGNVPVVNIARLGADSSGNYLNGHIRQITYLPRRISNADLVTRST